MKDILEKLSSYNIFNYFVPGILFSIIAKEFSGYNFIQEDILLGVFLYYFFGMVISSIGSIIIEPILKKASFVKFEKYDDFVKASKKDKKIELLSEISNTYRTLATMFALLLILNVYSIFSGNLNIPSSPNLYIVIVLLFILFLFSHKKQSNYITKRIKANL